MVRPRPNGGPPGRWWRGGEAGGVGKPWMNRRLWMNPRAEWAKGTRADRGGTSREVAQTLHGLPDRRYPGPMGTVFTKIINGELPGRFVYRDDKVVAFLTIEPVAYGHTLVIPVEEVDKWTDADPALWAHMNEVAQKVGNAIIEVFDAPRAGYMIAGFEVPHAHIHVFPASDMSGYSLANINRNPDEDKMDDAANRLREALGTTDLA